MIITREEWSQRQVERIMQAHRWHANCDPNICDAMRRVVTVSVYSAVVGPPAEQAIGWTDEIREDILSDESSG